MSRPLRIQAAGAIYHVTSRGNRRALIFIDDYDYATWLTMLGETAARFQFIVHLYCQMPNHYHLVVETPLGNIAGGMHYLNGKYFQYFNRKHKLVGHVAQGRYHAVLIEREQHLLESARYLVRNPVRAELARDAQDWKWSNHRAFLGIEAIPEWLCTDWILDQFGNGTRAQRILAYEEFVRQGQGKSNPLRFLRPQPNSTMRGTAPALPWQEYCARFTDQAEAVLHAALSSTYSIRAIARHTNMSPRSVMRLLHRLNKSDAPPESDPSP